MMVNEEVICSRWKKLYQPDESSLEVQIFKEAYRQAARLNLPDA